VAELYGPAETVPVIDVKAQEGEDKRWTMAKWADYYEQEGEKPVRNVISLEVSRSKLGRLIRRPKVVRDMDLQDSVWPEDDKRNAPPVQFYCLMSVADCYTDFHIDFGGSSVYYHIIKGRKTFFFIPPTKQNLKKYEDWCLSPSQSHDFLGLRVKECYRVDLYPGDTMLIPSGWIHAVWTPEDSLVIGGNYLTRIHYGMQIKVLEIEKNTKVAARFRYPFFQKIMWLAVIKYLEEDPLPLSVEELLLSGSKFERELPIYCEPDKFGHNSDLGPENYNQRYYSKAELDGLPDLQNYIWRSVMISQGKIEGITQQTRNAVTRSIPKSHGEPSIIARKFAMWAAWKRGNEHIPQWALADGTLPEDKKLTAAQTKIERESWSETLKLVRGGERHSSLRARVSESSVNGERSSQAGPPVTGFLRPHREHVTTPKTSQLGPKRIACDACRKRRIRCKHKDELVESPQSSASGSNGVHIPQSSSPVASLGDGITRRYSDADIPTGPLPYPRYDLQATINGGPVTTDPIVDALGSKSGRVKACADCRKSKVRRSLMLQLSQLTWISADVSMTNMGMSTQSRQPRHLSPGAQLPRGGASKTTTAKRSPRRSKWSRLLGLWMARSRTGIGILCRRRVRRAPQALERSWLLIQLLSVPGRLTRAGCLSTLNSRIRTGLVRLQRLLHRAAKNLLLLLLRMR
jgi:F-box/leucine-rich repeat protein 10/11